jgi:bloom syndrome protein
MFRYISMTRDNLRDHLSWLLANLTATTPNAPILPSPRDLPTDFSQPDSTAASSDLETRVKTTHQTAIATATSRLSRADLAHASDGSRGISVDTVERLPDVKTVGRTERAESVETAESMGKLTSGSKSKRPTLMLRQEQLKSPSSTTATTSLSAAYSNYLKNSGLSDLS